MRRLLWLLEHASPVGPAALAGLLLALAAGLHWLWLSPLQARVKQLETAAAQRQPATAPGDGRASHLDVFHAQFVSVRAMPAQLAKLHQIAQAHGIVLHQGDYKLLRQPEVKLLQYQMTLPAQGSYVKLRRFIAAVLEAMPAVALDHVSFERQRAGDELVDARMRLTLFLYDHEVDTR